MKATEFIGGIMESYAESTFCIAIMLMIMYAIAYCSEKKS